MQFACQTAHCSVIRRSSYYAAQKKGLSSPQFDIPRPQCKNDQWDSLHDEQYLRGVGRTSGGDHGGYIMERCFTPFGSVSSSCGVPVRWRRSPSTLPREYGPPSAAPLGRFSPAGESFSRKGNNSLPAVALLG